MLLFSSTMKRATPLSTSTSTTRKLCSLLVLVSVLNSVQCTATDGVVAVEEEPLEASSPKLEDFTIKDATEDLLALPTNTGPHATVVAAPPEVIARNGPITQYQLGKATSFVDNKAEESSYLPVASQSAVPPEDGGNSVVYARYPWSRPIPPSSQMMASPSAYYTRHVQQQQGYQNSGIARSASAQSMQEHRRPFAFNVGSGTVTMPNAQSSPYSSGYGSQNLMTAGTAYYPQDTITQSASNQEEAGASSPLLRHHPHLTSIDQHQKDQHQHQRPGLTQHQFQHATAAAIAAGSTTAGFHPGPPPAHLVETVQEITENEHQILAQQLGSSADIYKTATRSPLKLVRNMMSAISKFSVPRDHYLNVVSFAGIYMFLAIMFYGHDEVFPQKCEDPEAEGYLQKEWHYHVGRRFVPGMRNVDEKLQLKFLRLFRGMYNDEEDDDSNSGGSSSSEEDMSSISQLCPREAFFYSMAPMHLQARLAVQRLLVAQPTPEEVYHVSKELLYRYRIHPKVWYLGLLAAAGERPDMTGFQLAHPLDAIPDWFIPADLIREELDRYRTGFRSGRVLKRGRRAIITKNNSTLIIGEDTPVIITYSTSTSKGNSSSSSTSTTRRPLYATRRTTTTRRPDNSLESNSVETFVLDGMPAHLKLENNKGEQSDDYVFYDEEALNHSVEKYQSQNVKRSKYKPKKRKKSTSNSPLTIPGAITSIDNLNFGDSSGSSSNQIQSDVIGPATSASQQVIHLIIPSENLKLQQQAQNHLPQQSQNGNGGGSGNKKKNRPNRRNRHKKGKGKGKGSDDDSDEDEDCIIVDGKVGRDNGVENKLWYYREDLQLNQHHFYWHMGHPLNATKHPDRRAELFFFSHRQFLARYNAERLSNGLHRFKEMELAPGSLVLEPYHSHLADVASGQYWTPRHPKRLLRDIHHIHNPDIITNILLKDVKLIYGLLQKAVKTGIMISRKGLLPISHTRGIEALSNTVEATELSVNPGLYNAFGLHNMGHLLIGLIEDPDWSYKKTPGVFADVATSMRDPIFYPYHAVIDNIFEKNKEGLPPYKIVGGEFQLLWKGVEVLDIEINSKGSGPPNQLRTFWTKKKFELAPSVDKSTAREDHANVCAVHLAHEPFTFKITIDRKPCTKSKSSKGTVRIFMAPRYDEKGRRIHLIQQRRLMIQLDAFQAKLRVGKNIITRRSHDSSLTKPWSKSLREYEQGPDPHGAADFCGCGWPQHLYVPKGSPKGLPFDLFVMVTNFDEDFVPNDPDDLALPETCNSPYLMCGHPRRRYPDARPMGYPFDRPPYKTPIPCLPGYSFASVICKSFNLVFFKPVDTLEEFSAKATNMKSTVFNIKHIDKLVGGYYH